eukprot:1542703-Rhodomonas_salina.2
MHRATISVQSVPGMRVRAFDFAVCEATLNHGRPLLCAAIPIALGEVMSSASGAQRDARMSITVPRGDETTKAFLVQLEATGTDVAAVPRVMLGGHRGAVSKLGRRCMRGLNPGQAGCFHRSRATRNAILRMPYRSGNWRMVVGNLGVMIRMGCSHSFAAHQVQRET